MNRSKFILIAAALAGLSAAPAYAAGDESITARQACMKAQGKAVFGGFFPILKGEAAYDAAAIKAGFDAMDAACKDFAIFWTDDAQTGTIPTKAKPEIWTDKEGFAAVGGKAFEAMTALRAAADEASFKAALPAVADGCNGCHEKFRLPMK